MKLNRWAAAIAIVAGMSVAAVEAAPTRGGKLTYARYADSLFLDPVLNDANVDIWIFTNLYDTLLQPTADGKSVEPGLAQSHAMSADGKMMTLTMRPGLKFANGNAVALSDVKWSLDRARSIGPWKDQLNSIQEVVTEGADKVVLKLNRVDPTLVPALATFNAAIMPQKLFEAEPGADDAAKAKSFATHPIGTGPFMMTEWKRGERMVLKRNPHHWRMGEDGKALPYLDEINFVIIPDDATRILKLQAGEVDGAEFIPYARAKELSADSRLDMKLFPSTRVAYLGINIRPTLKDGTKNPLSDQKVRQALNYAIDKNAIIQITTFGLGKQMQTFMSSTTPMALLNGPLYAFDPVKAKTLLSQSSYPNGFEMTCLSLSGNADDNSNLSTVQQMWAQIGVKLKIQQVDSATRTARYRADDFQCRTAAWTNDVNDPSQITSYFAYYKVVAAIHSGYRDDRVEKLFEASHVEADQVKRAAMYKEIQERYNDSAVILNLYETPYPVALRKQVKGFNQIPLGNNIFAATYIEK